MQRRYLFLINPRAGTQQDASLQQLIQKTCSAESVLFELLNTPSDYDYSPIRKKIQAQAITDVIICGGDGTISAVVAALRILPVQFGVIPRGSGNGLALAAGIPKNPRKALDVVLRGRPQPVDAFLINEQFSCMLSGVGFDAQVAHDFDRQSKRGFWKYAQLTFRNFFGIKTYPFVLQTQDTVLHTEAFFVSIANSNQFGNHFTIAPKASLQDGLLDIVVVEKTNKLLFLLRVLWHIRFGTFTQNLSQRHGIIYLQSKKLELQNPALAPFHIDGDGKSTASEFSVTVLPAAYQLLLP